MHITDKVLRSFKVARTYDVFSGKVNCVDYSSNGEYAVSSSEDDSIMLYDIQQGKPTGQLFSMKYGVDLIRFTNRDNDTVVYSSNKQDGNNNLIRYDTCPSLTTCSFDISLATPHDTLTYLLSFSNEMKQTDEGRVLYVGDVLGGQSYKEPYPISSCTVVPSTPNIRVTALSMSPVEDTFISSSLDETIRIWDLRLPACQGLTNTQGRPVCSFDPDGLIFAAGVDSHAVKLYDLRAFDKGPFSCFETRFNRVCNWTGLKFSKDGKFILICTNAGAIRVLNSFSGSVLHTFSGYNNSKGVSLEACFTPDSQFVMIGSEDGRVHVWSVESGMKVAVLDGKHQGPINTLQFNPLYMTFASACSNMMFWLPCGDDF